MDPTEQAPGTGALRLVPLAGSERPPAPGVAAAAPVPGDTPVEVTLVLRRAAPLDVDALDAPMAREELARAHGAAPADVALVSTTLERLGVEVLEVDAPSRRVRAAGSAETLGAVFGARLVEGPQPGDRRRSGSLSVPAELGGVVVAVLGLDDRPQARSRHVVVPAARAGTSYAPTELGAVYSFPGTDGSGRTVAIVELGGGFDQDDLDVYFADLGVSPPPVLVRGVDGATNAPDGDPSGADGEVALDVEVVGALAPGAQVVVWFAPNTDAGFLDAVAGAAHADPTPDAVSISWGQQEDAWTAQARGALDEAMADAEALGVVVSVAAGDDGSTDRAGDGRDHVDFPASSPHALACGGTRLDADGATGRVRAETVWGGAGAATGGGATGGGVSDAFARPAWQRSAGVPGARGRGVPDVAAVADPATGYRVRVDGQDTVIGGTSAVAPLWAALVARLVQATGRALGPFAPRLYAGTGAGEVAPGFRDVTVGSNGSYRAGPGWDACTGLGVPVGTALLAALEARDEGGDGGGAPTG